MHSCDATRGLSCQARNGRTPVTSHGMDGKQIGLNACAAPRIGASDGIDDGEFVSRHTGNRSSTVGCHQQEGAQEHDMN